MNPLAALSALSAILSVAKKYEPELALLGLAAYHLFGKSDKATAIADLLDAAKELGIDVPAEVLALLGLPQAQAAPDQAPVLSAS